MLIQKKKILFLDQKIIDSNTNVQFMTHPPVDREIIFYPDKPWEDRMLSIFSTVLFIDGKYMLFYSTCNKEGERNTAYAESSDGINFIKPDLNVFNYKGSTKNNLVGIYTHEANIIYEPDADEEFRFKAFASYPGGGIAVHTSPDGIHWKISDKPIINGFGCDTQNMCLYDPNLGRYVFYLRGFDYTLGARYGNFKRIVIRGDTEDILKEQKIVRKEGIFNFYHETKHGLEKPSNEFEHVLCCDADDDPDTDIYNISASIYEEYYIGFPSFYKHAPGPELGGRINDGDLEVFFIGSLDGKRWNRYDRKPYIKNETTGNFSCKMAFMGVGVVPFESGLRQYGVIFRTRHGGTPERIENKDGKMVCYTQRKDGFVSAHFGPDGGQLTTCVWFFNGTKLYMNANTNVLGYIKVAILDIDGNPISDFSFEKFEPFNRNLEQFELKWEGSDISILKGEYIRILIQGKCADLFSLFYQ